MLIQRQIAQGFTGHLINAALCGTLMTTTWLGQDRVSHDAAVDGVLKALLQNYLRSGSSEFDKTTGYSAAPANLSGAKVPEVVYVSGAAHGAGAVVAQR